VFENRGLRRIFELKRVKVTGGWKKLHNEELHNLYSLPNIIRMMKSRKMKWAWLVARMEAKRNTYRVSVGKTVGKRPLGRHRRSWEDNIKLDVREVEFNGMDCVDLAEDRGQWRALVNMEMNLRVAQNVEIFLSS
jgi:hypothetical protein